MDWDAFGTAWHDSGCRILADLAVAHPGERLYAAAFHLFYSDDDKILSPAFAANTEAAVHRNHGYSTRFAPPEWRWDVLDAASEAMRPWYHRLTEEFLAPASTDAERDAAGDALEVAHDGAIARVCKAMTATARRGGIHDSLSTNFVVVILEGQRGDEEADLIRASVDPQALATVPELAEYMREFEVA
ncbi:hypothetical protein GCM10022225_84520 [Plantactinospora mayteni]|uniref:DUF4303 domain-containing protein n=1 Tax=Plantactinospora mayteni TaxID=566021 RepID=A0ABQ4F4T8_9ACTN|nr:DUF4303 domain-containing protein [Plantactinospora mayteni]GIH01892.1 hypothetical protein Pma05_84640 [Plantactinospora mayteni]